MKSFLTKLQSRVFAPIDIASLVFFRITFGLLMVSEVCRYFRNGWVYSHWVEPRILFKYYGFSWVHPWPGQWLYVHWAALGLLGLFVAAGFFYRVSATLMFLSYAYFFLLDETWYVNHTYLFCLFCLLLVFVPANRALSVDNWLWPSLRSDFAPAWSLWLLRFQIGVVYFFGGLVKISPDWLRGEPMRFELAHSINTPIVGRFFPEEWAVYAVSYGGLLFDVLIVPLLLWRRTRLAAFCAAVLFHLIKREVVEACAGQQSDIVEIGGGNGHFFDHVEELARSYINIEPGKIRLDEKSLRRLQNGKYQCIKCSAEELPLLDECADIVVSCGALDHIPSYEKSLGEINRVLRRDGFFILQLNNLKESFFSP